MPMCGGADVQEKRQHSGVKEHEKVQIHSTSAPLWHSQSSGSDRQRVALPAEVNSQSTDEHFPASLDKQEWESKGAH